MIDLKKIKQIYNENENMMGYMRNLRDGDKNTAEEIMISYDFQAGSYTKGYYQNPARRERFLARLSHTIVSKNISGRLLEAGVGEATSLIPLLKSLPENQFEEVYGFDISWSRIQAAKKFSREQGINNIEFCTGDLLSIPMVDNYFDLVYTIHAVEPNGGQEKEILQELYRVCRDTLILMEPCYEFAGQEARERMTKHGYVTRLAETARELNYDVETYELYGVSANELNPTGLMIVHKEQRRESAGGLCAQ